MTPRRPFTCAAHDVGRGLFHVYDVVRSLIDSGKKDLKKEACWIVSNVTAGSAMQIDAVCASGLVPSLIRAHGGEIGPET